NGRIPPGALTVTRKFPRALESSARTLRVISHVAVALLLSAARWAIPPAPLARATATPNQPQRHSAAADTNYSLTTSTCQPCGTDDLDQWQSIVANQLGVAGRDPVGWWI